ncbi:hypothetical protein F5Y16DRAFT_282898 [Xylariaceae sp. FL0255]|nr:hypothetical protein F5Y16DRAFT_282898 [Xylariaceae sp. FL0255]
MCRVGSILMTAPGCNHLRQSGWRDSAVGTHLGALITRCTSCKANQAFCGKLTIDKSLDPSGRSTSGRTSSTGHPLGSLYDRCKFCTSYESEICLADSIKQSLVDYNMALLTDDVRDYVQNEMDRTFQRAVDQAVKVFGPDGRSRDKALRTLDAEYQKASEEISRICGERQLAPYRELYGR